MQSDTASQCVLLIDDDPIAEYLVRENLRFLNPNIQLKSFRNPLRAVVLLSEMQLNPGDQRWPDVIFIDLNTPLFNAWDFLEHYQELGDKKALKTPIVILTSEVSDGLRLRSQRYDKLNLELREKPITHEIIRNKLLPQQRKKVA